MKLKKGTVFKNTFAKRETYFIYDQMGEKNSIVGIRIVKDGKGWAIKYNHSYPVIWCGEEESAHLAKIGKVDIEKYLIDSIKGMSA